jgi:hypothetical protein
MPKSFNLDLVTSLEKRSKNLPKKSTNLIITVKIRTLDYLNQRKKNWF